jgi:hypothetical protein
MKRTQQYQVLGVVDFCHNSILGGYIIDFAIDCTLSYSVTEREFRTYLKSLSTWIKMLPSDKGFMKIEYDFPSS